MSDFGFFVFVFVQSTIEMFDGCDCLERGNEKE